MGYQSCSLNCLSKENWRTGDYFKTFPSKSTFLWFISEHHLSLRTQEKVGCATQAADRKEQPGGLSSICLSPRLQHQSSRASVATRKTHFDLGPMKLGCSLRQIQLTHQTLVHYFLYFKRISHSKTSDTQIVLFSCCYALPVSLPHSCSLFMSPIPLLHCSTFLWHWWLGSHFHPFHHLKASLFLNQI